MKSLLIILLGIALGWHFTDFESTETTAGIVAPLVLVISVAALAGWLVLRVYPLGRGGDADNNAYPESFDDGGD